MFGYVRFLLASAVLLSHHRIRVYKLNPGVVAVVVFYMLAGFVVTHLLTKIFPRGKKALLLFYLERFLRIYPLYLFVLLLALIFLLITDFRSPIFTPGRIINNLLIVPLNYYMFIRSRVMNYPNGWLIPPAWSLGTELQAYLLLPLILISFRTKIVLALASLFIFFLASLAVLNSDFFGYRLIVGVFFIFILGSCIYKSVKTPQNADLFDRFFPILVYAFCIVVFVALGLLGQIYQPNKKYIPEVLLGILLAMPIIYCGASTRIKLPYNSLLGALSYGVFLSHTLVKWFFLYLFPGSNMKSITSLAFVFFVSVLLAWIGRYVAERPVIGLRRKLSGLASSKRIS